MAHDRGTPTDPLASLAFEIERFEWTGDDRLEVTGRWFGVRGLRFMRPTLHVRLGDRRRRLIALLDDKPWPADAEGTWTAAFSWRGPHDGVTAARLEVAPDVVLDLPAPGGDAAGATLNPRPRARPKPPAPRRNPEPPPAAEPPRAEPPPPPAEPPRSEPPPAAVATPSPAPAEPPRSEPPPAAVATPSPAPAESPRTEPPPAAVVAPSPPAVEPPASPPASAPSSPAAELTALALERRLVEERAARERLEAELGEAREQIAALSAHHDTAVERSREVVRLEGELAAAIARAERAELADVRAPIEVAPLPSRVAARRRSTPEWGTGTRVAAVAFVALLLAALVVILTLV